MDRRNRRGRVGRALCQVVGNVSVEQPLRKARRDRSKTGKPRRTPQTSDMSDVELRRFGQQAKKLSEPKMNSGATEPHVIELEEDRGE
jgi:hypothetical protein